MSATHPDGSEDIEDYEDDTPISQILLARNSEAEKDNQRALLLQELLEADEGNDDSLMEVPSVFWNKKCKKQCKVSSEPRAVMKTDVIEKQVKDQLDSFYGTPTKQMSKSEEFHCLAIVKENQKPGNSLSSSSPESQQDSASPDSPYYDDSYDKRFLGTGKCGLPHVIDAICPYCMERERKEAEERQKKEWLAGQRAFRRERKAREWAKWEAINEARRIKKEKEERKQKRLPAMWSVDSNCTKKNKIHK